MAGAARRARRRAPEAAPTPRPRYVGRHTYAEVMPAEDGGDGVHFDANKGTPMKEWLSLDPDSGQDWLSLAREALDFAQSR